MSKKLKLTLAVILIAVFGFGLFYYFKSQGKDQSLVEKEISIQQTEVGIDNYLTHQNYAGFSFEYPDNLTLTETELTNDNVYASVEMTAADGKKMTLRIYDDQFTDLDAWLDNYENDHVIVDLENLLWADIPAKRFTAETPPQQITVALEDGVVYLLKSPADSAFFRTAHDHLVTSFKFSPQDTSQPAQAAPQEENTDNVTLIEEKVI